MVTATVCPLHIVRTVHCIDGTDLFSLSSVGLKTVIAELPGTTQTVATNASRNITGKLVDAIARPVSVDRPFNWKGETTLWVVFLFFLT